MAKQPIKRYNPATPAWETIAAGSISDGTNEISPTEIGLLSSLTTTDKTSMVAAINENAGKVGTLSSLTTTVKTSIVNAINELFNTTPKKTTANITLYVRTDGNDANDGLTNTSGGAIRNIQTAINKIVQLPNHDVAINVANGTYAEDVTVKGFTGSGTITITGNVTTPSNVSVSSFLVLAVKCNIIIQGFTGTSTTTIPFYAKYSDAITFTKCVTTVAVGLNGFQAEFSTVYVYLCTVSNRNIGIVSLLGSTVISNTNSGTGNTTGLYADGAVIRKGTSQPAGTTAETIVNGGQIV